MKGYPIIYGVVRNYEDIYGVVRNYEENFAVDKSISFVGGIFEPHDCKIYYRFRFSIERVIFRSDLLAGLMFLLPLTD